MKNFLYKEIKLCMAPINIIFLLFTMMIIIPNYPYYVPFFYLCLSVYMIFNLGELNKDIAYSMILPIKKSDIVKSRCILIAAYEITGIILTLPFVFFKHNILTMQNDAGIECNFAFYGFQMILLTLFHFVFFTTFYKKAEKPGISFLISSIVYWIGYFIFEFPFWVNSIFQNEFIKSLDSVSPENFNVQIPFLISGILIYIIGWIVTYKVSANKFNKVDI
ncbi:MAG: hypothetical protein GX220_06230 [Treponema sp.]|nr:hypothetical protein [Treponema sp.]